ncbi:MAG: TldD/PmbA family protein [Parasporobacterium sp.]|nr:TldD/PmbA family protein [Parasporobacterium sp.]
MEKYIEILKSCGADAWEIQDTKTRGWEFYFIGHRLDQNRAKDVEHINLKVYKLSEDGQSLGIASAEVSPTDNEETIRKTAENLVYQASLVKNKPYQLNQPEEAKLQEAEIKPLAMEAESFIKTMLGIEETGTEYLNSFEIFVNQNEQRLITSEGIDITQSYPTSMLDLVVNARKEEHEIELYRLYHLGSCEPEQIKRDVEELLQFGKDRLLAVSTPQLEHTPVLLSTDAALSVYEYFLSNLDAAYLLRGMSSYEIGKPIAEDIQGDRITIRSARTLPGSPCNFAYDEEGAVIRDEVLMEESVPKKFVGSRKFSQYLGLEDSFMVSNWCVSGGRKSADELRTGKFLEIVEFSDFQVDSMTGDIFGEIRLAYYHDGEGNVTPVSGGSVSGSMLDNIAHLQMSGETRRYANAEIPSVTRLENVVIAG